MTIFHKAADIEGIIKTIKPKIKALLNECKYGISIEIEELKKTRTDAQNKLLWAVYKHIVDFWSTTGFIIDDLNIRYINSNFIHGYFKARFDIKSTKKLTTIEFMNYVDGIQNIMIEQTKGEYDPIYIEEM